MKKQLLPESGNFYKANLHCHSNLSDGKNSPAEIKARYVEHGYQIIAFTDHDVFVPHNDLTDDNFLALNGFEMEINEDFGSADKAVLKKRFEQLKTCHICFIARDPEQTVQPFWNPEYTFAGAVETAKIVKYDTNKPLYKREYNPEKISEVMQGCRDEGFFVTYNHPQWSLENYGDYINYNGMHAMEICNYGCQTGGWDEYNTQAYDDMLRSGKRIFAVASDDNHNHTPTTSRAYDSYGGFVMIKADRLEYKTVTDALVKGDFYASEGPIINALWVEGDEVHIECEAADRIAMKTGSRSNKIVFDEKGDGITEAVFKIEPFFDYFRITVIDKFGKHADTRAYFLDELGF